MSSKKEMFTRCRYLWKTLKSSNSGNHSQISDLNGHSERSERKFESVSSRFYETTLTLFFCLHLFDSTFSLHPHVFSNMCTRI